MVEENINVNTEKHELPHTLIIHSGTSPKCFCSSGCTASQPSLTYFFSFSLISRLAETKTYVKGNQHTLPSVITHRAPRKGNMFIRTLKISLHSLRDVLPPPPQTIKVIRLARVSLLEDVALATFLSRIRRHVGKRAQHSQPESAEAHHVKEKTRKIDNHCLSLPQRCKLLSV